MNEKNQKLTRQEIISRQLFAAALEDLWNALRVEFGHKWPYGESGRNGEYTDQFREWCRALYGHYELSTLIEAADRVVGDMSGFVYPPTLAELRQYLRGIRRHSKLFRAESSAPKKTNGIPIPGLEHIAPNNPEQQIYLEMMRECLAGKSSFDEPEKAEAECQFRLENRGTDDG